MLYSILNINIRIYNKYIEKKERSKVTKFQIEIKSFLRAASFSLYVKVQVPRRIFAIGGAFFPQVKINEVFL